MKEITTTSVHQFGDGLLVEVVGIGEHGDVITETIEFDPVEPDSENVTPRGDIPSTYETEVYTLLSEKGYSVVEHEPNEVQ